MADLNGFVKIYRQIIKWGWYRDIPVKVLFLHCLFMANYQQANWYSKTIERGSFVTSIEELSQQTGLTVQNTRTALKKLISTGEITKSSTNRYTVITVVNYEKFQNSDKFLTDKSTDTANNSQQTTNKQLTSQLTTNEEVKEIKNINNTTDLLTFEKRCFDFSEYTEKEMTNLFPNTTLTVAEYDVLFKYVKETALNRYCEKIKQYTGCKNQFETILKWAADDNQLKVKI